MNACISAPCWNAFRSALIFTFSLHFNECYLDTLVFESPITVFPRWRKRQILKRKEKGQELPWCIIKVVSSLSTTGVYLEHEPRGHDNEVRCLLLQFLKGNGIQVQPVFIKLSNTINWALTFLVVFFLDLRGKTSLNSIKYEEVICPFLGLCTCRFFFYWFRSKSSIHYQNTVVI